MWVAVVMDPKDPLLAFVGGLRDFLVRLTERATFKLAFACGFTLAAQLASSWLPADMLTKALSLLTAATLGACLGQQIDDWRRERARRLREKKE